MKDINIEYVMVTEEGIVAWLTEPQATEASGYGHNIYQVKEVRDTRTGVEGWEIEATMWFDPGGYCRVVVNRFPLEDCIRNVDKMCREFTV